MEESVTLTKSEIREVFELWKNEWIEKQQLISLSTPENYDTEGAATTFLAYCELVKSE